MKNFLLAAIILTFESLAFGIVTSPDSLADWILKVNDPEISETIELAQLHDGIDTLADDIPGLTLFFPDNKSWNANPGWLKKLRGYPDLRYDVILASGAEINGASRSNHLQSMMQHQKVYGVIDTGYGTPYFLINKTKLCLGQWNYDKDSYAPVDSQCAHIKPAYQLNDAFIYKIDNIILPEELVDELNYN